MILEWKAQRRRWIAARDGKKDGDLEERSSALDTILCRAGCASFGSENVEGMSAAEYFPLTYTLAPVESDGLGDTEEWNLFERYLPAEDDVESLNDRHSLSDILRFWDNHIVCFLCPFTLLLAFLFTSFASKTVSINGLDESG